MENRTMFPNLNKASIRYLTENLSGNFEYRNSYHFSENIRLLFSRQRLKFLEWLLPLDALFDQEFLDMLGDSRTIEIEEMNITVIGSILSKEPKNFNVIYANCNTVKLDHWPVKKLTPKILITAFSKFIGYFRKVRTQPGHSLSHLQGLKTIHIHCITPVLILDCQYVQILFEAFYKSSFYDITQHFSVQDTCNDFTSSVAHLPLPGHGDNIVLIKLNLGHLGIDQLKSLYLILGLVLEQDFYFYRVQDCTKNRQLHTYSRDASKFICHKL